MERTQIIQHRGTPVVLLDYSGLRVEAETLVEIDKSKQFIVRHLKPDGTHLTLTDGTDASYTPRVLEALKQLAAHDKPYVKAGAAVSNSRLVRVVVAAVAVFTGRHIPVFPTRDQALEWLMKQ
ncbi:MAG TPA: hypothetical protein VF832_14560 [Longimicrobiales bacterium]